MPTVHTLLSEQFYRWERRGRGYEVYNEPICPEPPFERFSGHFLPPSPALDDGLRPTLLSSITGRLFGRAQKQLAPAIPNEEEPEPVPLFRSAVTEFEIVLQRDCDVPRDTFGNFLRTLNLCPEPISFELVGRKGLVSAHLAAAKSDGRILERETAAHFPEVMLIPREDLLEGLWNDSDGEEALALEFGLKREFMFMLSVPRIDSHVGLVAALSSAKDGELALFQVLFQPIDDRWRESILAAVSHGDGRAFFVNAPELSTSVRLNFR